MVQFQQQSAEDRLARLAKGSLSIWLNSIVLSAGIASLIWLLLVLPWTINSWSKLEFDLPKLLTTIYNYRLLFAAIIVAITASAVAAIFYVRNKIIKLLVVAFAVVILVGFAVGGLLSWWLVYVDALNQQFEM